MPKTIYKKAFTLIELLVVVAIISLLSSVVIVSLQDSREKAAIAKLKEQTRQIQTALELYRNDHGEYPDYTFVNLETVISNDLSPYIEDVTLDISNIRNTPIITSDIGVTFGFINNDSLYEFNGMRASCAGYDDTPYIINFMTDGTETDDFLVELLQLGEGGSYEEQSPIYCLNTPI